MTRLLRRAVLALLPLVVILLAWSVLVPGGSRLAFLLSRPDEIAAAAARLWATKAYWVDFYISASVLLAGYVIGCLFGYLAGLLIWIAGRRGRVAEFYLLALGSIPLFSIAPLLIFVFGIGTGTRLIIVSISVFIPMAQASLASANDAERRFADTISAFRMSRSASLHLIVAPGAFFTSLPALKPAANGALVALFLSEWISAERGLAKFVLASMSIYAVPDMWVGLITFVALGVSFGLIVDWLEWRLTIWRRS